jgi:hypothetical protein
MHWLIFGVVMALIPFGAAILSDSDRGISITLGTLFGQGELLIVATIISAGGIGDLFGAKVGESRRTARLLVLGFSIVSLVATSYWFADVSSLLFTKHPADAQTVAKGSILLFLFAIVGGISALVLSEGEG